MIMESLMDLEGQGSKLSISTSMVINTSDSVYRDNMFLSSRGADLPLSTDISALIVNSPTSSYSVHAERRAQQRHRKRLAKIVVEQWKYFARPRLLALRLWKICGIRMRRICFDTWRNYLKKKKDKDRNVDKGKTLHAKFLLLKTFCTWCLFTKQRQQTQLMTSMVRRHLSKMALLLLCENARRHAVQKQQLVKAHKYLQLSILSKCFSNWSLALQAGAEKKHLNKLALAKWAYSKLRLSFMTWKKFVYQEAQVDAMRNNMHYRLIKECISQWRSKAGYIINIRMYISVAKDRSNRRIQESIFMEWRAASSMKDAEDWYANKTSVKVFKIWKKIAESLHRSRKFAVPHFNRKVLARAFNGWKKIYVEALKKEDSAFKFYNSKLLARNFNLWGSGYLHNKRHKKMQREVAINHWKNHKLRQCTISLHFYSAYSRRKREESEVAVDKSKLNLLKRSFSVWNHLIQTLEADHASLLFQLKKQLNIITKGSMWAKWKAMHKSLRKEAILANLLQHRRIKCMLKAWRLALHNRKDYQLLEDEAVGSYKKLLKKRALRGLSEWDCSQREEINTPIFERGASSSVRCFLQPDHMICSRPPPRVPSFMLKDIGSGGDCHFSKQRIICGSICSSQGMDLPLRKCACQKSHVNQVNCPVFYCKPIKEPSSSLGQLNGKSVCNKMVDIKELDPQLISEQIAWMEHIVREYDDLKAEIVQKRAELASYDNERKSVHLKQRIAMLQERVQILQCVIPKAHVLVGNLQAKRPAV